MKFTFSWLKEYLKGDFSPDDVVQGLVEIGLEVESVTNESERLKDFILAEIRETRRHPEADRLQICTVDTGQQTIELVCGGKNARPGIKVILAPVGSVIPSTGQILKVGKVRGVESPGMLCSADELLLDISCDGILELETDYPLGTNAAVALGIDDPVIEIAITPNRADCFSVLGVARDLYAYFRMQKKEVMLRPFESIEYQGDASLLTITHQVPQACYAFGLTLMHNVHNRQSPKWMEDRLRAIGLRPLSALVDITNYLCFDAGRPMHVFDADKVQGAINLRFSSKGESFEALDDKIYMLDEGMLVICDEAGIISLAGIMGGKRTGCDMNTKNVLVESAWFDPVTIATTGQKLQITSDARMRFERGVDPALVKPGMHKAIAMIQEMCGGDVRGMQWISSRTHEPHSVTLTATKLTRVSGERFNMEDVKESLMFLGFSMSSSDADHVSVMVPSYRHDIHEEIDLVEEVIRLRGTGRIQEIPLSLKPLSAKRTAVTEVLSTTLVNLGYVETVNFSFIVQKTAALFGDEHALIHLKNPITVELTTMRPSLLPSLLSVVVENQKRTQETIPLFETAHIYGNHLKDYQTLHCAAVWAGKNHPKHWRRKQEDISIFDVKDHMMTVLSTFGIKEANLQIVAEAPSYYHPTRAATLKQGNRTLGYVGQVHPNIQKYFDMSGSVCGFELMVDYLPAFKEKRSGLAQTFSPYQPVEKDFAFWVDKTMDGGKLTQLLTQKLTRQSTFPKGVTLERVDLFDVFEGAKDSVLEGKKSLAVSLRFQPQEVTLSESVLDQMMKTVITLVEKEIGGTLRQ